MPRETTTGEVPMVAPEEAPTKEPKDELAEAREKKERETLMGEIGNLIRGLSS